MNEFHFYSRVSPDFHYNRDIILYKKEINSFLTKPKEEVNFTHDFPWSATVSDQDSGLNVAMKSDNNSKDWWYCFKLLFYKEKIAHFIEALESILPFKGQAQADIFGY